LFADASASSLSRAPQHLDRQRKQSSARGLARILRCDSTAPRRAQPQANGSERRKTFPLNLPADAAFYGLRHGLHRSFAEEHVMRTKQMEKTLLFSGLLAISFASPLAYGQRTPRTPAQAMTGNFTAVNKRVLEMAEDFPAEKYDYRPGKDVRSFGEVLVHVIAGNIYASKAGRGENVRWEEIDPKSYKGKSEIVAALKKSIDEANATLKAVPEDRFSKTLSPWIDVLEHAAEHYGQLVVYYRMNGMTPPASRPKTKTN